MKCFSCGDVHERVRGPLDWTADHGIRTVRRSRSSLHLTGNWVPKGRRSLNLGAKTKFFGSEIGHEF